MLFQDPFRWRKYSLRTPQDSFLDSFRILLAFIFQLLRLFQDPFDWARIQKLLQDSFRNFSGFFWLYFAAVGVFQDPFNRAGIQRTFRILWASFCNGRDYFRIFLAEEGIKGFFQDSFGSVFQLLGLFQDWFGWRRIQRILSGFFGFMLVFFGWFQDSFRSNYPKFRILKIPSNPSGYSRYNCQ